MKLVIITIKIAIIINSNKHDIWDMNKLFHKLKNFWISEQSTWNKALEDGVEGNFTFYFLSMIIHKYSSQYWIVKDVKDGVPCIPYWQAELGTFQCCNIVPSLVSYIGKIGQLPRGFDHFCWAGNPPSPRGAGRPSLTQPIPTWILGYRVIKIHFDKSNKPQHRKSFFRHLLRKVNKNRCSLRLHLTTMQSSTFSG